MMSVMGILEKKNHHVVTGLHSALYINMKKKICVVWVICYQGSFELLALHILFNCYDDEVWTTHEIEAKVSFNKKSF